MGLKDYGIQSYKILNFYNYQPIYNKHNHMKKKDLKERIRQAILAEAKKKKKSKAEPEAEDINIDTTDMESDLGAGMMQSTDTMGDDSRIDMNMDTQLDMDASSPEAKKAFSELTDAYRAAKELGDEKLIQQLANTITYFSKNIILSQG